MTMKPLADRVLIKVEKEEEKTVGGLVLATKNPAGVPAKGKVVACGEGKFSPNGTRVPMEVKVGDTVRIIDGAFTDYTGKITEIDNNKVKMVISMFGNDTIAEVNLNQIAEL